MPATIRQAQPSDLEALGRMGAQLMRIHYQFDPLRFLAPRGGVEEGYSSFLMSVSVEPGNIVFVAEEDGRIAGYVYAALEPLSWKELRGPAGFIHDLLVEEHARHRGIATRLMQRAAEWLREQGAPRVLLGTAAPNEPARRLFASLGFRETMIEMTRELDPPHGDKE